MTGIWHKSGPTPVTPCTVNELIDNLEAIKKLMTALHAVWCDGELVIDFSQKTFRGKDLHPLVQRGIENLGFMWED